MFNKINLSAAGVFACTSRPSESCFIKPDRVYLLRKRREGHMVGEAVEDTAQYFK